MSNFELEFEGYWRDSNVRGVPNESGIYCVYRCTYDSANKTVSLKKLIYIGESEKVQDRIINHERKNDWKSKLLTNEQLCYSFAPVKKYRKLKEGILIFKFQSGPVCNDDKNDEPNLDTYFNPPVPKKITINISGDNQYLNSTIVFP